MATAPKSKKEIAKHYMEPLDLAGFLPINVGLTSAAEETMASLLGPPMLPLTTDCQTNKASDLVKKLRTTEKMSKVFSLTGIKPAVESAKTVLARVFGENSDLEEVLSTEGMLCVRFRKPTSGKKSTKVSNHSWGTAVDFKIVGFGAPTNTKTKIPRFIALMLPHFHAAGWFSGIAFRDTMHFEVAEETIRKWSGDGLLSTNA